MIHDCFIEDIVEQSVWLRGTFTGDCWQSNFCGNPIIFMMRIRSFAPICLSGIKALHNADLKEEMDFWISVGSICKDLLSNEFDLWLLHADLINLCKRELPIFVFRKNIAITHSNKNFNIHEPLDQNGEYLSTPIFDRRICLDSEFSKASGLEAFSTLELPPKIKRFGAFPFLVPKSAERCSLRLKNGTFRRCVD